MGSRVAVIGSGISGLSAAWLLENSGKLVTLYESERYFGGHTLTDETLEGCPVDLGFQVFNRSTYGHFEQFLEALGVDSEESDMSFSLSVDGGRLEWGSHSLATIFAQWSNLLSPSFLLMIREVIRFGKEAPEVLKSDEYKKMNLGEYLARKSYSKGFAEHYLVPMCAAIWSISNKQCMEFPIQVLIRFWTNHHLLDILVRPKWRVVKNRSRSYVEKVLEKLKDARCETPVQSVVRRLGEVIVKDASGREDVFDDVVFATHSDVTLKILGSDATPEEVEMLKGVPYADNDVYLHRDLALMPKDRKVWSSWNVLQGSGTGGNERPVCVSYYINSLQRLPQNSGDLFVTLNPPIAPAPNKTIRKLVLSHPVFSFASLATQEKVLQMNGKNKTWFCGAWCGYGFHEDGIKAAVKVVEGMGVTVPWTPRPTSPYTPWLDRLSVALVDRLLRAALTKGSIRFIMPNGCEQTYGNPPDETCKSRNICHSRVRVFDCKMFSRIMKTTDIGLGESYMMGEFEPDDLTNFLNVLTQNVTSINSSQGKLGLANWLGSKVQSMAHMARANTIEGSRRNISEHYDLGNDMYRLFLDESWMYSSAFFQSEADSLYQAQLNKLDKIIDKLELKASDHIVEIGCGWGGFAIRAVERFQCKVTGVTISEEQFAYTKERVSKAGLDKKITILLCDYRKMEHLFGLFDKLVSIEMVEAVGHENLGEYFAIIDRLLKPGGKAVIQAITYKDDFYESYCRCSDFIRHHIFPGGHLPSMKAMLEAIGQTDLACYHVEDIGLHYARTLKLWHANWVAQKQAIQNLGHNEVFFRKWRFYFSYCEAGFQQQFIHCYQIVWAKAPVSLSRRESSRCGTMRVDTGFIFLAWCFLSGLAVGKYFATLYMVPMFALAFFLLSFLSQTLSAGLPFISMLDASGRAMWDSSFVSAVFSGCTLVLWLLGWVQGDFRDRTASPQGICQVLLSLWSGYSGWAIFNALGRRRAALRAELWSNTLALACTCVCLARQRMGAYLCLVLVSQAHGLLWHLHSLALLCGWRVPVLAAADLVGLGVFRLVAHGSLAALVARELHLFPHPVFWAAALGGLAVVNLADWRMALDRLIAGHPAARHAPRH